MSVDVDWTELLVFDTRFHVVGNAGTLQSSVKVGLFALLVVIVRSIVFADFGRHILFHVFVILVETDRHALRLIDVIVALRVVDRQIEVRDLLSQIDPTRRNARPSACQSNPRLHHACLLHEWSRSSKS